MKKGGYYSSEDIINGRTLFKEIRYLIIVSYKRTSFEKKSNNIQLRRLYKSVYFNLVDSYIFRGIGQNLEELARGIDQNLEESARNQFLVGSASKISKIRTFGRLLDFFLLF